MAELIILFCFAFGADKQMHAIFFKLFHIYHSDVFILFYFSIVFSIVMVNHQMNLNKSWVITNHAEVSSPAVTS